MVVIVDYGLGNLHSIKSKIERLGYSALVSRNPSDVVNAGRLILPGVGNFGKGMANLKSWGLQDALNSAVKENKIPIFGICLGLQLFFEKSEESGESKGLGWITGSVVRFADQRLRIPHVGWNLVSPKGQSKLFKNVDLEERFYFTHSYFALPKDPDALAGVTDYGQSFTSAIEFGNIHGVQFHPEKSRRNGLRIIDNFLRQS